MKKKIMLLMATLMVANTTSVFAVQFKPSGTVAQAFSKANEPLDINADKYPEYKTLEELSSRKSILKIDLKKDSGADIREEFSFGLTLTNGTFNEDKPELYEYINTNGVDRVSYEQVMKGATTLKDVYYNITTPSSEDNLQPNTEYDIATFSELNKVIKEVAKNSNNELDNVSTVDDFIKIPSVKTELNKVISKIAYPNVNKNILPHIPYKLEITSPTTARVTIPNLNLSDEDESITLPQKDIVINFLDSTSTPITDFSSSGGKVGDIKSLKFTLKDSTGVKLKAPYIAIPLGGVIAESDSPVKVKVDASYTNKITGGEYQLNKTSSNNNNQDNSTVLEYEESQIKKFDEDVTLNPIRLKENGRNLIGKSNDKTKATIYLKVNGGFKFKESTLKVIDDVTGKELTEPDVKVELTNNNTYKIELQNLQPNRQNPIGFRFDGIQVQPDRKDSYGEVTITVSGDGIKTETKKVAVRDKLGYTLEAKSPKEIITGRYYDLDKNNLTEQDFITDEITFKEVVPNTLVPSRNLEFKVPEGVKITNLVLDNPKNVTDLDLKDFIITDEGKTLQLSKDSYKTTNKPAEIKFKLGLSISPSVKDDIKLTVTGGGNSEVLETVIAKAISPIEVSTSTTTVNSGQQVSDTQDITIKESKAGSLLQGNEVILKVDAPFGSTEVGFSGAEYEVEGKELQIKTKDFQVKDGVIKFRIDKASIKEPSTIKIKNVKVGSTRAIPYGVYNVSISGDAVINNYNKDADKDTSYTVSSIQGQDIPELYTQADVSQFIIKDYLKLGDKPSDNNSPIQDTVKVTLGSKTVLIGDKELTMDVEPYIQKNSNSTMVPLRFVSLALGIDNTDNPDESSKISYEPTTKTTTIYQNNKTIQFQAGSNIMVVNGTQIPMGYGVIAEIKDSRMFVPFRALGEALGVEVKWDADTKTAIYNNQ